MAAWFWLVFWDNDLLLCERQLSFVRTVVLNVTSISKQAMKTFRPLICFQTKRPVVDIKNLLPLRVSYWYYFCCFHTVSNMAGVQTKVATEVHFWRPKAMARCECPSVWMVTHMIGTDINTTPTSFPNVHIPVNLLNVGNIGKYFHWHCLEIGGHGLEYPRYDQVLQASWFL